MEAVKEVIEHLKKHVKEYKVEEKPKKKGVDVFDVKRVKEENEWLLEKHVSKPKESLEEGHKNLLEGIVNKEEVRWKANEEREDVSKRDFVRQNVVYAQPTPPPGAEGEGSHQAYHNNSHGESEHHHYHSNHKSNYQH